MNGASAFSLRQLQYFCTVVESGSITEAARRLHVSPGGVSLAITQLEELLDVQLTLRTRGKGVEITDAGRSVYDTARVIARSVEGNVRTLLDWKGALAVAGVLGAVSAVMAVVRRR